MISLGSNATSHAGDPKQTILSAIARLRHEDLAVVAVSRLYLTPCMPKGAGNDYINAAVCVKSQFEAPALLERLQLIEEEFGRKRTGRWESRTLDLDLLDHGASILPDIAEYERWRTLPFEEQRVVTPDALVLPHPRIQDRAFVLVPLADIAETWVHPVLGHSVRDMLASCPDEDREQIRPIPSTKVLSSV